MLVAVTGITCGSERMMTTKQVQPMARQEMILDTVGGRANGPGLKATSGWSAKIRLRWC